MNKIRITLIAVAAVVLISAIAAITINANRNARLTIIVTPVDSTIQINGKQFNNGTTDRFPGEVEIKVSHDGLDDKVIKLNLESHKTTTAHIYLTKDGKFDYYESSKTDYDVLRLIGDEKVKDYLKETERKLTIKDVLPISRITASDTPNKKNGMYSRETIINDGTSNPECDRIICLLLIDNTESDDVARELMKEYGYDFDDYKIIRE